MRKLATNPLIIGGLLLIIFRLGLWLTVGNLQDGNFLILVLLPWLILSVVTLALQLCYRHFKA